VRRPLSVENPLKMRRLKYLELNDDENPTGWSL
jgi:hypothetical protein